MQARQLLPLSGVTAVILVAAGFGASGDAPSNGDGAAAIRAFYVDHSTAQHLGGFLLMIAAPFLVVFAATLRAALAEQTSGLRAQWGNVVLAGGAIAAAGFLLAAALQFALADAPEALGTSATQALNELSSECWPAFTGGLGVLLLGAAGGLVTQPGGLRWFGWTALLLGIAIFTPIGFAAFAGSGLWLVLVSVALAMGIREQRPGLASSVALG